MTKTSIEEKHEQILSQVWPDFELYETNVYIQEILEDFFIDFTSEKKCEVLDIGCGHNSENLESFIDKINLTGIDMDEDAINRHPWLKEKYIASCEKLPLPSDKYDFVFGRYSFEHFQDKEAAVAEISRVLKNGGLCILLTVNRHALEFKVAKLLAPRVRARVKNFLMRYPEIDTYETNYEFNDEKGVLRVLNQHQLAVKKPIHLMSSTSGFLRRFKFFCYAGSFYSKLLHKFNLRLLMAQMTVVAYKKNSTFNN
jgi:ubiquinone/menaquinone biosynthesis C-methylase UbiE